VKLQKFAKLSQGPLAPRFCSLI